MKNYTKTHSSKKVAEIHMEKIKRRGGVATMNPVQGGFQIDYSFPERSTSKKQAPLKKTAKKIAAKKEKLYDVLSPDGFTIRLDDQDFFKSLKEAKAYFNKWKKRYEKQGYYSSGHGRIELEDLIDECEVQEFNSRDEISPLR